MTLAQTARFTTTPEVPAPPRREPLQEQNVGAVERKVSIGAGAIAAVLGLARGDLTGLAIAAVGGGLIYRGLTGACPAYRAMGVNTNVETSEDVQTELEQHGTKVEHSVLIGRDASELYPMWRDFEGLPDLMSHLKSVEVLDDRRSRWTTKAPILVGGSVSWEAEMTEDVPNERIAWQSIPGSTVANAGTVWFEKAPGDRGTIVHVVLDYTPPGGVVGKVAAKLFGQDPHRQLREDLRHFKRRIELGEELTTKGQPTGSCW
ncbi:MAG: SRPBCC family protein [Tepidisphaeraceae bacterium]